MHGAYYYTTTDTYCMASAVRARERARPWRLMGAPSLASPCGVRHSEVPFRRALPKYPSEVAAWHTGRAAGRGPAASVPPAHFGHRRHPTQLPSPGLVKDGCLNSKAPRSQPPLGKGASSRRPEGEGGRAIAPNQSGAPSAGAPPPARSRPARHPRHIKKPRTTAAT